MSGYDYEICLRNIAWLRAHHGLSEVQMSRLLHIGVPTLARIESGDVTVSLGGNTLYRIYDAFDVQPDVLFGRRLGE